MIPGYYPLVKFRVEKTYAEYHILCSWQLNTYLRNNDNLPASKNTRFKKKKENPRIRLSLRPHTVNRIRVSLRHYEVFTDIHVENQPATAVGQNNWLAEKPWLAQVSTFYRATPATWTLYQML